MSASRRSWLQGAGLLGLWPFSRLAAARAPRRVYEELGIRPLINFQGTTTTTGASKMVPELHDAMAEASSSFVFLEELQKKAGERIARLCATEDSMVTTGAAGAIALGTCAALTGGDVQKVRRLPDLTGMKTEVVIQKAHRNGYDHAVRSTGVRIVEVNTPDELAAALGPDTAMLYFLGGTSHDWESELPIPLETCLAMCKKAGVPVLVDAANMLPPWSNIPKLAAMGVDMIAISGGKHIRGPQCSGVLAGRKDLVRAAWLNSSPHADSHGRPMKAGREEIVGCWLAIERYAKLDFDEIDRQSAAQADYLIREFSRLPGLSAARLPFDRTRRVHRVHLTWDEQKLGLTARDVERQLVEGDPRIVILRNKTQGLEFTVFMNDPGDEKLATRRVREIFSRPRS